MCKYPSDERINPCHDTINTIKRTLKEAKGNKIGEAEENKGKRDDLIACVQKVQYIATKQTNNLHQDMTLPKLRYRNLIQKRK